MCYNSPMTNHSFAKVFFNAATLTTLVILAGTGAGIAHATVGGPTYVYDFTYNPANESVYYISNAMSGRGCPPELMRLSLVDSTIQKAYSCEEAEAQLTPPTTYLSPIINITETFKHLASINLKKNNISVDVRFLNYKNISLDVSEIKKANFVATAYQGDEKLVDFPIVGCSAEQPFTFAGYAIPGFEKKIILLLSAKGDCWEGGYTRESLYVVGGVSNLDKTPIGNFYKNASALVPNEGTLVVFAKDADSDTTSTTTTETPATHKTSNPTILLVGALLIGLIAGVTLGRVRK